MIRTYSLLLGALALALTFAGNTFAQDQQAPAGTKTQPSAGSKVGSFFKQLGHSVGQAAEQIGGAAVQTVTHTGSAKWQPFTANATPHGNDGIHGDAADGGMTWNRDVFDPPVLDGYTHIRWGASAQSRYNGEGTLGVHTCDPQYIGLAVLHLPPSGFGDDALKNCLYNEKQINPTATMETVTKRIAELGTTRKYYYRGMIHGMLWNTPGSPRIRPTDDGSLFQLLGGAVSAMVQAGPGYGFNIVGPHWSLGTVNLLYGWPQGLIDAPMNWGTTVYKIAIDIDHSKVVPTQLISLSYVFFTVGTPRLLTQGTGSDKWYELPIRIDKIVFVGNGYQSTYVETLPITARGH